MDKQEELVFTGKEISQKEFAKKTKQKVQRINILISLGQLDYTTIGGHRVVYDTEKNYLRALKKNKN